VVLANPDLKLRSQPATPDLSDEQRERMLLIFDMLISLFERAYLLVYDQRMDAKKRRRWHSWDDYMREWSQREDFRARLPELLRGEDPDFAAYLRCSRPTPGNSPGRTDDWQCEPSPISMPCMTRQVCGGCAT